MRAFRNSDYQNSSELKIADGLNPIPFSFEELEDTVNRFRSAAQAAGRDPSTLKIIPRAISLAITAEPLPESNRPFLGGSPAQIAPDLARVETLGVDPFPLHLPHCLVEAGCDSVYKVLLQNGKRPYLKEGGVPGVPFPVSR